MQLSKILSPFAQALGLQALLACEATSVRPPPPPHGFGPSQTTDEPVDIHVWQAVRRDLAHAPKRIWNDGRLVFTDRTNWLCILGASAYALWSESFEENEAVFFKNHTLFGTDMQNFLGALGNGATLYGGTLIWYFWAASHDDVQSYEASKTLFSAMTVTAVTTTLLKAFIKDGRPDGGSHDFPSGHASQSMAVAATLDELYGRAIGWPAYALSGLVGLQRLDTGKHDTGAVVFGWVLGYVVGHTVAGHHEPRIFGMDVGMSYEEEMGELALNLSRTF
jgi:membrane-associated phospholipid phosphatase